MCAKNQDPKLLTARELLLHTLLCKIQLPEISYNFRKRLLEVHVYLITTSETPHSTLVLTRQKPAAADQNVKILTFIGLEV